MGLETSSSPEKQLSESQLERLIFLSFMHSQGDGKLHNYLILWLHNWYGSQDETKFEAAWQSFCDKQSPNKSDFMLATKKSHTERAIPGHNYVDGIPNPLIVSQTVSDQKRFVVGLIENFNLYESKDQHLKLILTQLLATDHDYVKLGRPNRNSSAKADTLRHAHFSFVIHYLLKGEQTGDPAFDALYKELKGILRNKVRIVIAHLCWIKL